MVFAFSIPCFTEQSSRVLDQYTEQLSDDMVVLATITENDSYSRLLKSFQKANSITIPAPMLEKLLLQPPSTITVPLAAQPV